MNNIQIYLLLYFLLFSISISAQIQMKLITNPDSPRFGQLQIEGIELSEDWNHNTLSQKDWNSIFSIQFGETIQTNLPPMLGKYEVQENVIFFQARFPFAQGKIYTASFHAEIFNQKTGLNISNQNTIHTFQIPVLQEIKPTYVKHIYPSVAVLPMNQLKLYLHFSAPMRVGQAFDFIKLLNKKGQVVQDPFLYMDKELWDKDQKRLTIWFDPGRIKRDLSPNQLLGLPLQNGQSYKLVIDKNWQDIHGNSLEESYKKSFSVVDSDRKMPKVADWKLTYPSLNTKEPLEIDFGEAMDFALLQHSLVVLDHENKVVVGHIEIKNEEKVWQFRPEKSWKIGDYTIKLATILEDLAGNNLNRLFDRDMRVDAAAVENRDIIEIKFNIGHY